MTEIVHIKTRARALMRRRRRLDRGNNNVEKKKIAGADTAPPRRRRRRRCSRQPHALRPHRSRRTAADALMHPARGVCIYVHRRRYLQLVVLRCRPPSFRRWRRTHSLTHLLAVSHAQSVFHRTQPPRLASINNKIIGVRK